MRMSILSGTRGILGRHHLSGTPAYHRDCSERTPTPDLWKSIFTVIQQMQAASERVAMRVWRCVGDENVHIVRDSVPNREHHGCEFLYYDALQAAVERIEDVGGGFSNLLMVYIVDQPKSDDNRDRLAFRIPQPPVSACIYKHRLGMNETFASRTCTRT
jgi:hypothetical protein